MDGFECSKFKELASQVEVQRAPRASSFISNGKPYEIETLTL